MTDFFKHGNKVYSENLNDGILVGNSFDWTVNISLPVDTGGVFPNSTTAVKAKVADCSITPNSNLSIGETITNNAGSSQVYRLTVYPNFNRFGGFTFVSLEGDGSVIITEKGGTSPVRNNLDYANLGNVTELKTLKEYDLVVTIPSGGEVTGLSFGFQSTTGGANASISQANVTGLVSDLSGIRDDLSSLESGKADIMHSHATSVVYDKAALPNIGTRVNALQSEVNGAVDNKIGSLSTSIANHLEDLTWIKFYDSNGVQLWTNKALKLSYLHFDRNVSVGAGSTTTIKGNYSTTDEQIPYCPPSNTVCPTSQKDVYLSVNSVGGIKLLNNGSALSNHNVQGMMVFKAKG